MLIQVVQLSNCARERQEQRDRKSWTCLLLALGLSGGLVVGVLAGVLVGVLAGVLVDGVVAGLFLLGCLISSNSSLGSWGIFVLNLSQEPFVHM